MTREVLAGIVARDAAEFDPEPGHPRPDEPGFCAVCGVPLATDKAALAHLSEALDAERANVRLAALDPELPA